MNKQLSIRLIACLCVCALVFSLLPLYALAMYNHPFYDDFGFSVRIHWVWTDTGSVAEAVREAWRNMLSTRQTWQGNYTATFLSGIQPGVFDEDLYFLTTCILLTSLIAGCAALIAAALRRLLNADWAAVALIASLLLFLIVQTTPAVDEAYFWFNGGIGYTFNYALLALAGSLAIRLWRCATKRRAALHVAVLAVLLVLLALLAGGFLIHQVLVRPPDLPDSQQEMGTDPGALGAGRKEGVYTFLLVGRDDGGGGNTDTIMVGCFDVKNGTVDVLSIYRDTLVDVPLEIPKINAVYNHQGIQGVREQVKNLIGYAPDYYFVVELDAVEELVDAIGGVDYDVPYSMHYDDPSQNLHIHYEKGPQHLSGADAVKVLRWRKNNSGEALSVGDVGRVEVQHSFLRALAGEMVSLGTLTKIGDIVDIVDRNLESNLKYGEMIWFGERALGLGKDSIRFHNLPGDYTGTMWSPTYRNYQSYVFVNSSALRELVNQFMNPYLEDITAEMQHVVKDTTVNNLPVEGSDQTGTETE